MKATNPQILVVVGNYANAAVSTGILSILSALQFVVPILPDPYTTNVALDVQDSKLGELIIRLSWNLEAPVVYDLFLPSSSLRRVQVAVGTLGTLFPGPQVSHFCKINTNSKSTVLLPERFPTLLD